MRTISENVADVGNSGRIRRVTADVRLPSAYGTFRAVGYEDTDAGNQHIALISGTLNPDVPTLARLHSECLTGDVFGSLRCDCGEQLHRAMQMVGGEGGVIVYLRHHEGRGIGLHNKLRAYQLQDDGLDTVEANARLGFPPDLREFAVGAEILSDLGLRKVRFITNNPAKLEGVFGPAKGQEYGLELVETVPIEIEPNEHSRRYLETKRTKLGHRLHVVERVGGQNEKVPQDGACGTSLRTRSR